MKCPLALKSKELFKTVKKLRQVMEKLSQERSTSYIE